MSLGNIPGLGAVAYEKKVQLPSNFLNPSDYDALSNLQIDGLPNLADIYGNGSITGFLEKVGSVLYTSSQVVRWGEDRRIHLFYEGVTRNGKVFTKTGGHAIRVSENVFVSDGTKIEYGIVSAVTATTFTVESNLTAGFTIGNANIKVSVLAGTEFLPGTYGMAEGVDLGYDTKFNTKTIVKDSDIIADTHGNEIIWVKAGLGGGKEGWLWTFRNNKLKIRFENQREAKFWATQQAQAGSDMAATGLGKTTGAFEQIAKGGMNWSGFPTAMTDWEQIIAVLDAQAGIRDNMLWLNTLSDLAFSKAVKAETTIGYGAFNNGQDQAYKLDFRGFEIGGYNFFKTKAKFLNEATGFGSLTGAGKVNGLMIPMGTTNVYDENGAVKNVPFIHAVSRKGLRGQDRFYSVNPDAANKDLDGEKITMLSEFAPVVVGSNNFGIFK